MSQPSIDLKAALEREVVWERFEHEIAQRLFHKIGLYRMFGSDFDDPDLQSVAQIRLAAWKTLEKIKCLLQKN